MKGGDIKRNDSQPKVGRKSRQKKTNPNFNHFYPGGNLWKQKSMEQKLNARANAGIAH
jgi:hypothetical protein